MNQYYSNGKLKIPFADDLDTAGGILAVQNKLGVKVLVDVAALVIGTPSTGACTVDVGVAVNGTTSADNLIDGADMATPPTKSNGKGAGANGGRLVEWPVDGWITVSRASGAAAGLAGHLVLQVVRLD